MTLTDGEDAQKDFADWAEIENNYGNELSILDVLKACGWKVFVSDSVPDELVEILKGVD